MNFFVRYISDAPDEQKLFEVVPATSLYLAIKLFGPKLTRADNLLDNFVRMSNSRFNESHFVQMEVKMLNALSWHVHPDVPQDYIPYLIEILSHYYPILDQSNKVVLIELSIYMLELTLFSPDFVFDSPSSIAIAAIGVAFRGVNATDSLRNTEQEFEYLTPLFKHQLALSGTVMDLIQKLNSYLAKITPMLDGAGLTVDPTGIMYKKAIFS